MYPFTIKLYPSIPSMYVFQPSPSIHRFCQAGAIAAALTKAADQTNGGSLACWADLAAEEGIIVDTTLQVT